MSRKLYNKWTEITNELKAYIVVHVISYIKKITTEMKWSKGRMDETTHLHV